MKKYLKILYEAFLAEKKQYLFHIFVSVSLLIVWLWSIELIRRLILSIEQDTWFNVTVQYGVFAIILILLVFIWKIYFSYLRPKSIFSIQNYFYKKYLSKYILLDNEKVNNYWTGKFINIINWWVISTSEILYMLLFEILISIIWYTFNITMIWYINIYLILPVIFITILLFASMNYTWDKTFKHRKDRKILWEKQSKQTLKILMEKFTILKNWKRNEEVQKVLSLNEEVQSSWRKITFYVRLLEEWSQTIIDIGEIVLILIIGYFIYRQTSSFADIGALLFIMALIKKNINTLSIYYRQATNMQNDFTRLVDIFDEIEPIQNYETWKKYIYKSGDIDVKNLDFKYPNWKEVFTQLSLHIPAKTKVAFIGRSWSWKSTLVKLILAFLWKQDGSILIDGQELSELSLKSYYKYIGYLPQETSVFDWTILENITYWIDSTEQLNNLDKIIKLSACEFIYDLADWLDTEIWEKWIKLSWWERQRIAIARLLLQDPKIIILDEPTSALDSFSEESIKKALSNLTEWKTVITIAHRLQTIVSSDSIFIFEDGKIVDSWKHKELLKKSKTYNELIDLQNGGVY
jgi:ATP-binding cassette, subfamily B, bacterial